VPFLGKADPRRTLRVALVQMNVSLGRPRRNLERFLARLDGEAADRPATDLLLLPEMWSTGYDFANFPRLAKTTPAILARLQEIARQRQTAIGGTLLEEEKGCFYNTFYLIGTDGEICARYRKIHLFSLMDEPRHLTPGNQPVLTAVGGIPAGLLTCYDLRFPELSRSLFLLGARIILVAAQWPTARADHWLSLLKARAIENQLFVVACNRIGQGTEQHFPGLSTVFDPWGRQLLRAPRRQGIFAATLDLSLVDQARQTIDIMRDRRPACYRP